MDYDYIRENLSNVHENIETACSKSGRDVDSVKLIAVSKTKPFEDLLAAYNAGERILKIRFRKYVQNMNV